MGQPVALQGFISYAHDDRRLYDDLRPHLRGVERSCGITFWADTSLTAGTRWNDEIARRIQAAHVALLLMSYNAVGSDYICDIEIPAIERRRDDAGLLMIPVILNRCLWQHVCGAFQAVPMHAGHLLPVADWHPRDHGCHAVSEQIDRAIKAHFAPSPAP